MAIDGAPVGEVAPMIADRILALWNMAHDLGLTTAQIEAGIVGEMREALRLVGLGLFPADPNPLKLALDRDRARKAVEAVLSKLEPGR